MLGHKASGSLLSVGDTANSVASIRFKVTAEALALDCWAMPASWCVLGGGQLF